MAFILQTNLVMLDPLNSYMIDPCQLCEGLIQRTWQGGGGKGRGKGGRIE